jgi:hypothetical protein
MTSANSEDKRKLQSAQRQTQIKCSTPGLTQIDSESRALRARMVVAPDEREFGNLLVRRRSWPKSTLKVMGILWSTCLLMRFGLFAERITGCGNNFH